MCILEAQIIFKCREALLFGSMNSSDIRLPPLKLFGDKKMYQIFLDGFKIELSPSNDLPFQQWIFKILLTETCVGRRRKFDFKAI